MTHLTLVISNYLQSLIEGLIDVVKTFVQNRKRNSEISQTINELNKLSDKQLKDIGIHRGEIRCIAETTHNENLKGWV